MSKNFFRSFVLPERMRDSLRKLKGKCVTNDVEYGAVVSHLLEKAVEKEISKDDLSKDLFKFKLKGK